MPLKLLSLSLLNLLFAAAPLAAQSEINWHREWQGAGGQSIRSRLIAAWGPMAFFNSGSQLGAFPIQMLGEEDQQLVRAFQMEQRAKPAVEWREVNTGLWRDLKRWSFVQKDGKIHDFEPREGPEPDFYVLYFGAEWCGPCRRFVPELNTWYHTWKALFSNFEFFFVSWDQSRGEQLAYMKDEQIPFPGLKLGVDQSIRALKNIRPSGIPCLVVLDREGRPLYHTYRAGEYRGPTVVLDELRDLLLWANPDHPQTESLLFVYAKSNYLKRIGEKASSPVRYRGTLSAEVLERSGLAEIPVTLELDSAGRVKSVEIRREMPEDVRREIEGVLGEWLFIPAANAGRFAASTVRFAIRTE